MMVLLSMLHDLRHRGVREWDPPLQHQAAHPAPILFSALMNRCTPGASQTLNSGVIFADTATSADPDSFGHGSDAGDIDTDRTPASGVLQMALPGAIIRRDQWMEDFHLVERPAYPRRMRTCEIEQQPCKEHEQCDGTTTCPKGSNSNPFR